MSFHPWRAIRALIDVTVLFEAEPGRRGSWCARTRTIRIHPRALQVERRCTATHELVHVELGHAGCQDEATELAVRKEAARRLIRLPALADALMWTRDLAEQADELWVDVPTLQVRLQHLHPAERGYLRRRLAQREESA